MVKKNHEAIVSREKMDPAETKNLKAGGLKGRSGEEESWAEWLDATQKHWGFFPNLPWTSQVTFRSQGICTRVLLPVKLILLQLMQLPK